MYKAALAGAQAEMQRALAGVANTRAECNEQHQAITDNLAAVQKSVQEGLQASDQVRTAQNFQSVRVEAMGHRLGEMSDLLLQRESRMETQIYDLNNQMNAVLNAIDVLRRGRVEPLPNVECGVKATGDSAAGLTAKLAKTLCPVVPNPAILPLLVPSP